MRKLYEMLVFILLFGSMFYVVLFIFFFDSKCANYSNYNYSNQKNTIFQMAKCKDSFICKIDNVKNNEKNVTTDWQCVKKDYGIFKLEYYIK